MGNFESDMQTLFREKPEYFGKRKTAKNTKTLVVMAGGRDTEMVEILKAAKAKGIVVHDHNLGWGAKASSYQAEIETEIKDGNTPVLVELEQDIEIPPECVIIDHHGKYSDRDTSLRQFLNMIGVEPTGWQQLVSWDDCGHIVEMRRNGATDKEMQEVCQASQFIQGITGKQRAEAKQAVKHMKVRGDTFIVKCAHSKTNAVCDILLIAYPEKREDTLILSDDGEVNYFGPAEKCRELEEEFGKKYDTWSKIPTIDTGTGCFWGSSNTPHNAVKRMFSFLGL